MLEIHYNYDYYKLSDKEDGLLKEIAELSEEKINLLKKLMK